jgi:hypothetical protein
VVRVSIAEVGKNFAAGNVSKRTNLTAATTPPGLIRLPCAPLLQRNVSDSLICERFNRRTADPVQCIGVMSRPANLPLPGNRQTMKHLYQYFFRGLLAALPLGVTIYLLYLFLTWTESFAMWWLRPLLGDVYLPGFGLVIGIGVIVLLGFLISQPLARRCLWSRAFIRR